MALRYEVVPLFGRVCILGASHTEHLITAGFTALAKEVQREVCLATPPQDSLIDLPECLGRTLGHGGQFAKCPSDAPPPFRKRSRFLLGWLGQIVEP
jgi:hypothetical protein